MLRSVGDREADAFREHLDAALALRHELEQFEAMLMRHRLRHDGKLRMERALRTRT